MFKISHIKLSSAFYSSASSFFPKIWLLITNTAIRKARLHIRRELHIRTEIINRISLLFEEDQSLYIFSLN